MAMFKKLIEVEFPLPPTTALNILTARYLLKNCVCCWLCVPQSLHKPRAVIYPWKGWYDILCDELCRWWRQWRRHRDMTEHYRQGRFVAVNDLHTFPDSGGKNTTILHYTPLPLEAKRTQHTHRDLFGLAHALQWVLSMWGVREGLNTLVLLCVWIGHCVGGWVIRMEGKSTVNCQTVTAEIHHLWNQAVQVGKLTLKVGQTAISNWS